LTGKAPYKSAGQPARLLSDLRLAQGIEYEPRAGVPQRGADAATPGDGAAVMSSLGAAVGLLSDGGPALVALIPLDDPLSRKGASNGHEPAPHDVIRAVVLLEKNGYTFIPPVGPSTPALSSSTSWPRAIRWRRARPQLTACPRYSRSELGNSRSELENSPTSARKSHPKAVRKIRRAAGPRRFLILLYSPSELGNSLIGIGKIPPPAPKIPAPRLTARWSEAYFFKSAAGPRKIGFFAVFFPSY
jgi:hypothetical protein